MSNSRNISKAAAPNKLRTNKSMPEIAKKKKKNITTRSMIMQAISSLNDRRGSTVQAVKKYIEGSYCELTPRRAAMITRMMRTADEEGWLERVAGTGASSGSHFKISADVKKVMRKSENQAEKETDNKKSTKTKEAGGKKPKSGGVQAKKKTLASA